MKTHLTALAALLAAAAAALPAAGQAGKKKASPKPPDKPADPVERLAEVKPAAGFQVTMFAHPPDISYPACIACKPDGDVFVGVDTNGSLGKKPGGGRIVLCRDTDGDGKADKFVDFAKVESPRGLIWDRDRLYVLHPPFLSVFPDKGDGTAGPPTVLLRGLGPGIEGPRGADHTTNGIRMGVDGWIYIAVGDFGCPKAETRDGKTMVFHGGGVARVRPDGTELEIVSRGQRNIYDVGLSPTLEIFTRDNTNDGDGWDVRLSHIPAKIETVLRSELQTADGEPAARLAAEILRHRIDMPEAVARLVSLAAGEPRLRAVAVEVLARQPSLTDAMAGLLETVAADRSADAGLRAAALRTLGKSTDAAMTRRSVKALAAAYGDGSQVPGPVRSAWDDFARDKRHYRNVKFFAKLAGDGSGAEAELAWRVLLAVADGKGVEARFQQEAAKAIDAGWGRPAAAVKPLVNAVAGARSLEHAARLRSLVDGKDTPPDVRTAAVGALKALGLDKTADPKSLIAAKKYDDVLAAVLKAKGDPTAGAALFTRQNCVNCHTINKADPVKGPYLGDIANRYPRAELVEAILKPNAKIAQGFETQVFQKTDGVIETGFVTRESGEEVELRNANGAVLVIKKEDIEARKKAEQSVMPEGLVNNITPAELASLIAYLEQLAKDAKPDKP